MSPSLRAPSAGRRRSRREVHSRGRRTACRCRRAGANAASLHPIDELVCDFAQRDRRRGPQEAVGCCDDASGAPGLRFAGGREGLALLRAAPAERHGRLVRRLAVACSPVARRTALGVSDPDALRESSRVAIEAILPGFARLPRASRGSARLPNGLSSGLVRFLAVKKIPGTTTIMPMPPGGLEPPTHGLGNRCSIP